MENRKLDFRKNQKGLNMEDNAPSVFCFKGMYNCCKWIQQAFKGDCNKCQ